MLKLPLLEFMGIILILTTSILTHSNPYFIGLAYMSALLISHESPGHFNPIFLFMQYLLGRIPLNEFLKFLSIQLLAVIGFVIAYKY
jgi:glycerol uptake facilitator-like aquaporin